MQNIQGLDYQRVTDIRVLERGDFLRYIQDDENTGDLRTDLLQVVTPLGENGDHVRCLRLSRNPSEPVVELRPPDLAVCTVLRAVEIPRHGIPGTWCNGLDNGGDYCGKSVLHHGDCRH